MLSFFSRGQLGRGLIVEEQSPAIIPALEGIRVQFIAAGGWHSAAISGEKIRQMWYLLKPCNAYIQNTQRVPLII